MTAFKDKRCEPCEVGAIPLLPFEIEDNLKRISAGWESKDDKHIEKKFSFKDFAEAMEFANKIARLAEEEGHHPTLTIAWGMVRVKLYTSKIGGLHENDFIMAAKIDEL
ncbi:MAG: 4a-hydroxytetrahydrobiopterin dehydratase [Gudongella sp.]|jgi:4a-hydroxytetrahydrobiopterin dehydratase|nr:4a-hydroxytetrahydrobiopterin dehydratase [Gudongella sp.]